jgi:hypothetical protein
LGQITRFSVRSSGRDIRAVRRPAPTVAKPTVEGLRKAELVELAEERGLDTSGTKAEIAERLTSDDDVSTTSA